jgi:hypothetical protein
MRSTVNDWSVVVAVALAFVAMAVAGCADGEDEARLYVEEFRVAEPLLAQDEPSIADQWETITAVTEPYDDVEASVDEDSQRLATNPRELELQCVTVLKEMAFCTGEDPFLDVIGDAPNLRSADERERFLDLVQVWFEPGGTARDCRRILSQDEAQDEADIQEAKIMWQRTSRAAEKVCVPFAEELISTSAFSWIGHLWEE